MSWKTYFLLTGIIFALVAVCTENSDSDVVVMQSTEESM
jgi:hypothetical protein